VLAKREASNADADAGGEARGGDDNRGTDDGAEDQSEVSDDPEDGKVQRGEQPGGFLCFAV
jgi:hypothetical protein